MGRRARSDSQVYAEMSERAALMKTSPGVIALSEVIQRLGRAGRGIEARPEPQPGEELPTWLVERLTMKAGMPAVEVGELSLEQALDAWTHWTNTSDH